jgi:hypothetical protein
MDQERLGINACNFWIIVIKTLYEESCNIDDNKCESEKQYKLLRTASLESYEANQSKSHGTS